MKRTRRSWLLLLVPLIGLASRAAHAGEEAPTTPIGASATGLRVPDGFIVERVAASPLVEHPMMAGFDERGRLFVAEAAGLNLKADQLLKDLPNRIRLLEDTDGDGRFDKSTIFADEMTLPQGALWYAGRSTPPRRPACGGWKTPTATASPTPAGAGHRLSLHGQRGRHPRPVPRARRPALLVRRPARARDPAARRQPAEGQGRRHLSLPTRRHGGRGRLRRRHGQPGRGRLHGRGRAARHREHHPQSAQPPRRHHLLHRRGRLSVAWRRPIRNSSEPATCCPPSVRWAGSRRRA